MLRKKTELQEIEDAEKAFQAAEKENSRRIRRIILLSVALAILFILLALFAANAISLRDYYLQARDRGELKDELVQLVENARMTLQETVPEITQETQVPHEDAPELVEITDPETGKTVQILPEYADLYLLNTDFIGWIKIDDTNINYPVMQHLDQADYDEDFYLHRNFYGDYDGGGTIYADKGCDVLKPSDNIILYGHRMGDGSMFEALWDYRNKDFWQQHKTISFDTLHYRGIYEIFAVFKTTANDGGYPFYQFFDAEDETDYNSYIQDVKELSLYDTGITAHYGETLLTLCTCEYTTENGRLIIVARRIC